MEKDEIVKFRNFRIVKLILHRSERCKNSIKIKNNNY